MSLLDLLKNKRKTRPEFGIGLTFNEIRLRDDRSERAIRRELSKLSKDKKIVRVREKRFVYRQL